MGTPAQPEVNGTGTWVVQGVQTCGVPETGPPAIEGELDCAGGSNWVIQGSFDPAVPGHPSTEEALRSGLEPYAQRHGGEIVLVQDEIGSLVLEQREQVVLVHAIELPAGGWSVATLLCCDGFD